MWGAVNIPFFSLSKKTFRNLLCPISSNVLLLLLPCFLPVLHIHPFLSPLRIEEGRNEESRFSVSAGIRAIGSPCPYATSAPTYEPQTRGMCVSHEPRATTRQTRCPFRSVAFHFHFTSHRPFQPAIRYCHIARQPQVNDGVVAKARRFRAACMWHSCDLAGYGCVDMVVAAGVAVPVWRVQFV